MIKHISRQPDYKKAIRDISSLSRMQAVEFKAAVLKIVSQIAFDEILDITIIEKEE